MTRREKASYMKHGLVALGISISGCMVLKLERPLKVTEADWPTFGRVPAHSNVATDTISPPLTLEWEHDITGSSGNGSPLVVDNIVIIGNLKGEVYAINASTGKRIGWVDVGEAIQGSPYVDNNVVIVAAANTRESLVMYDLLEGRTRWQRAYGDIEVSPVLYDNKIYFGNTEGIFYCVERSAGDMVWKFDIPENTTHKGIRSSPAAEGMIVVFGADDGSVYALDAAGGRLRWEISTNASIAASPSITNSTVYVGNLGGVLHAIELQSGTLRWTFDAGASIYACPTIAPAASSGFAEDLVIVGTTGGILYALQQVDGTVVWRTNLGGVINSSAVVSGSVVYVGTLQKKLFGIRVRDGSVIWSLEMPGRIKTTPAVGNGRLIVATDDRLIVSLKQEAK